MDCVAGDRRVFGLTGDWSTATLDPEAWCNTVDEGVCRCMTARAKEEEKASENRQRKRESKNRR